LPAERLASISRTIGLAAVEEAAVELLAGRIKGRLVVDLAG
jgi:hypothetical protein